jgi:dipeptidyl aminopeptidase/acylaminoacyl peptidase
MLETPYKVTFSRHPRSGRWQIFYVSRDAAGIGNRMLMTAAVNTRTGAIEGEPARLVDALSNWVGSPHASFDVSPDGLIYWRSTTPALAIWRLHWFDRNGNIAGTVGDVAGFSSIALSPDESRLAALQGYPEQHIWLYNLQTGTGARSSSLSGSETNPVWSADGRSLYYTVVTETGTRVMRQAIEGGGLPEVLYESPESQLRSVQDITPDGRYLIVVQPVSPRSLLLDLTAPRESRKLEPLFPESAGLRVDGARLAPDGHSLVTRSGYTFYSSRFPPAVDPPQQIAVFQHPVWPFFSRDGRTLYFVSDQSLYSHPVTAMPGGGIRLGERSLLFKVVHPSRTDANLGAVSRDGKRWMVIATDNVDEARVQMLSDWTTLLPR